MASIKEIITEEIESLYQANFPNFGDRLDSIDEVGEGTAGAYAFHYDNVAFNQVEYQFATEDGDDYIVMFAMTGEHEWYVQFGIAGGTPFDIVDKGKLYKVMSTMVAIFNDFIEKHQPNLIKFEPSKDRERDDDDQRRLKLYKAFMDKNMHRNYTSDVRGDWMFIQRLIPRKS